MQPPSAEEFADLMARALQTLFGDLQPQTISDLIERIEIQRLARGQTLYRQGDPGGSLHLVLTGRLEVRVRSSDASLRLLARPQPGECVGEIALFTGEPRAATITAARDSTLGVLRQDDYERLVASRPELLTQLARRLVKRMSSSQMRPVAPATTRCIALRAVHPGIDSAAFARRLVAAVQGIRAAIVLDRDMAQAQLGANFDAMALGRWLDEKELQHGVLIAITGADAPQAADGLWTQACLGHADRVLWLADARAEPSAWNARNSVQSLDADASPADDWESGLHDLVLLHPGPTPPRGTRDWIAPRPGLRHHHLRVDSAADFNRLARSLCDCSMALVLAGGGARGFAHLGVFRALQELQIPVDAVGGTSFGAMAASCLARGMSLEQMLQEAREAFGVKSPLADYTLPLVSLLRGGDLDRLLQRNLPQQIEDLWLPFFAVSSNLSRNQVQVHDRGALWRAVRASVSLPAILPPVIDDGDLLVDGGVLNNLPVDVMRERTRGTFVAVDLTVEQEYRLSGAELPSAMEVFKSWILPGRRGAPAPTLGRIIMKTSTLASRREVQSARSAAHLTLNMELAQFDMMDWPRYRQIVDIGHEQALPQLQQWAERHPQQVHRDVAVAADSPILR